MFFSWTQIGYPERLSADGRDLWQKKDLGMFKASFSAIVSSHGVVMVKIY